METEIKLLLAPDAVAALRRHPLLNPESGPAPLTRRLDSVYFDTPDLRLHRRGLSLRVRDAGDARTQTLKSAGDDAPWQRGEWETPVDGERPDLARLGVAVDDAHVARLLKKQAVTGALTSLFAVRVDRTAWILTPQPGARVEIALDLGEIACGASRQPVCEVELEQLEPKAGDPAVLFDLALALLDAVPMRLGTASKSERGVALCCASAFPAASALPQVRRPGAGLPDRTMTVGRAFRRIATACLGRMLDHVDGVVDRGDAASVHRVRADLRRLRTALRLFRGVAPCPAPLLEDLRWLHDLLGEARDAGVLAGTTLPPLVARFPERADLPALQRAAAARATEAVAAAGEALASVRATRCFLGIGGWLARQGGRAVPGAGIPVAEFADRALRRQARRLRRRGRHPARLDARGRHRLRIAAKRLRDAAGFFRNLFPAREVDPLIDALSRLQDELGRQNDLVVARRRLAGAHAGGKGVEGHEDADGAAAFVDGFLAGVLLEPGKRLRRSWKRVRRRLRDVGHD